MWNDPVVEEIHAARATHAAQCDNDIQKMLADWLQRQEQDKQQGKAFVSLQTKVTRQEIPLTKIDATKKL